MSSTVAVAIATTTVVQAPAGTIFGGYSFSLLDHTGAAVVAGPNITTSVSSTFTAIPDGDYTVSVSAVDHTNAVIEHTTVTQAVIVSSAPMTVSVAAPSTLTVTVTPTPAA